MRYKTESNKGTHKKKIPKEQAKTHRGGAGGSRGDYKGIDGDDRDLIYVVNTQYTVQLVCCGIVHLKPVNFVNQCHQKKFNKKKRKS